MFGFLQVPVGDFTCTCAGEDAQLHWQCARVKILFVLCLCSCLTIIKFRLVVSGCPHLFTSITRKGSELNRFGCRYYKKRLLRIAPAYFMMLMVIRMLGAVLAESDSLPQHVR